MPTAAAANAKNCYISLNGIDISGEGSYVELTPTREIGTFNVFDSDWAQKLAGKRDWKGKLRVIYSEVASEGVDVIYNAWEAGAAVPLIVDPKGNTAGNWKFSGSVLIASAPIKLDAGDAKAILVEASFEGHGEMTRGTV